MKTSKINQNAESIIQGEQSWKKTVDKHGKTNSLNILTAIVGKKISQPHLSDIEKTIKEGTKLLKKKARKPDQKQLLKLTSNINSKASKIISKKQPTISQPTLYTAKTVDSKQIKKLQKIANNWLMNSATNIVLTKIIPTSDEKKQLIDDSINVLSAVVDTKSKINKNKEAVYCAYDTKNKIHAMAALHITKSGDRKVHLLASNPKNLLVFGVEDQIKGAGSSIMRHITHDTLNDPIHKKKPRTIKLMALDTAIPFYKKLGMEIYNTKSDKMNFPLDAMKKFVETRPNTHIISDSLPHHKLLK